MDELLTLIISALYLILPAYVANMSPVIFGKLKLPGGISINKKIFGANKTWRGFYAGFLTALLTLFIQYLLYENGILVSYSLLNYADISLLLFALLFGIGAITGDLIESFFKRRLKIAPGRPWIPFDQIDFILGAYLLLLPAYIMPWQVLLTLLIITPVLHLLTNILAYLVGLKKVWW